MSWIIMVILYLVIAGALLGLLFFWLEKRNPDWWSGGEDDFKAVFTMCLFWLPALAVALVVSPFVIAYMIVRRFTEREE